VPVTQAAGARTVIVEAMNPRLLVEVTDQPALKDFAEEVTAKLQAALDSLAVQSSI